MKPWNIIPYSIVSSIFSYWLRGSATVNMPYLYRNNVMREDFFDPIVPSIKYCNMLKNQVVSQYFVFFLFKSCLSFFKSRLNFLLFLTQDNDVVWRLSQNQNRESGLCSYCQLFYLQLYLFWQQDSSGHHSPLVRISFS